MAFARGAAAGRRRMAFAWGAAAGRFKVDLALCFLAEKGIAQAMAGCWPWAVLGIKDYRWTYVHS